MVRRVLYSQGCNYFRVRGLILRQTSFKHGFPAGNPIANVFVIIAGALIIGASIVLGFFAFIALSAIVLVTAAVIGIRVWWYGRKLKSGEGTVVNHSGTSRGGVIEGEYKVVDDGRDRP